MTIDIQAYYKKLADQEPISESEILDLLNEIKHFRKVAAHLASCHAATLESMPKSTSKSARSRMEEICDTAAKALRGDASGIRFPTNDMQREMERCERAVFESKSSQPAAGPKF